VYTHKNYRSKKDLKTDVAAGVVVTYYSPGLYPDPENGRSSLRCERRPAMDHGSRFASHPSGACRSRVHLTHDRERERRRAEAATTPAAPQSQRTATHPPRLPGGAGPITVQE